MKCFFAVSICLLALSCTRNVEQVEQNTATDGETFVAISESRIVAYRTIQRGVRLQEIRYDNINFQDLPIEITGIALRDNRRNIASDTGTFLLTNIIEDNVAVKNYPSLGRIIFNLNNNDIVQVIGFSGETVNVDEFYGFWVNITHQKTENEPIIGWVFSRYININNEKYTSLRLVEPVPDGHSISPGGLFIWNNYHGIVRGPFDNHFHYRNRPGVYILNTETLELEHKTYLGTFSPTPNAWTIFTEDFRFLLQDSGTSPGIRGIRAWRMSDFELVFSGSYHNLMSPPIIGDNIIEVVYSHTEWLIEHGFLTDEEIISFGRNFIEENQIPQELLDRHPSLSVELIIRCFFNLDTGERTILGGEWILTQ